MNARHTLPLVLIAGLCGCSGQPVPGPAAATREQYRDGRPVQEQREGPSISPQDPPPAEAAEQGSPTALNVLAAPREAPGSTESADAGHREVAEPHQRFLLLTPAGPLVVDLILTINGEPYEVTLQRLVDGALAAADANGDGQPTWEELARNPRFRDLSGNALDLDQMILRHDVNRNESVDRDELLRFLSRSPGSLRSFVLQSSNAHRGSNRSRSLLRLLLDGDRDGAITGDEMEQAAARLLEQDADDDEIVTLADFQGESEQIAGQMPHRRLVAEAEVALLINERTDWQYVHYSLKELYARGDQLAADDLSLTPGAGHALDADHNGVLDQDELKGLATIPPLVVLKASFGETSDADRRTARLHLQSLSESLGATARAHAARVLIELPQAEVQFFVSEDPTLYNYWHVAKSQVAALDRDQSGYLNDDEFSGCLLGYNASFEAVDADRDGRVQRDEVAQFLDRRQAQFRGQIRARAADREDALLAALDIDGDGRLSARELHGSPARLKSLDQNGDGRLHSHEIPAGMVVGFLRGDPVRDDELFATPPASLFAAHWPPPRWFSRMDINGDGDISLREFLGTPDQFRHLDGDGDGFVDPSEAVAQAEQGRLSRR